MVEAMRDLRVLVLLLAVGCRPDPATVQPARVAPPPADASVVEGAPDPATVEPPADAAAVTEKPRPQPQRSAVKQAQGAPRSCEGAAIKAELAKNPARLAAALAGAKLTAIVPIDLPNELGIRPGPTPREPPEWANSDARFAIRGKTTGDLVDYRYRGKPQRGLYVDAPRWVLATRGAEVYIAIPSTILELPCTSTVMMRGCDDHVPGRIVAIPPGTTFAGVLMLSWEHLQLQLVNSAPAACPA